MGAALVLGVALLVTPAAPVHAAVLDTSTIFAMDPLSGGMITVISTVRDDFFGDVSKYHFDYQVMNVSYDPTPGLSNGLSGYNVLFAGPVSSVADQYAPAGWMLNCCGTTPPFGAEADIDNMTGFGIPIGGIGNFGFSTLAGTGWTGVHQGSWAHSWENNAQTTIFDQIDTGSGLGLLVPVPEPGSLAFLLPGLVALGLLRQRRSL